MGVGVFFSVFLLCLSVDLGSTQCQMKAISWNPTYTAKGTLNIPYAELSEPFYVWYDGTNKRSRIDYYGGMVKTYQLSKYGDYGTSLKIAPVTTETETNAITCLQVNGTRDVSIEPQSILPVMTGFECKGQEVVYGITTEKWQLHQKIGEKENKYTLWMTWQTDPKTPGMKYAVPVRYEMKGFNSLLGSHYDHYFLEYTYFDVEDINPSVFEISSTGLKCQSFPGPGDRHIYTFNPMAEFIHPTTTSHVDFEFRKFKKKHGRNYVSNLEHEKRKEIFRQNIRYIYSVNRQNKGFVLSVNHLADKTDLEMKALRGRLHSGVPNGGMPFPYINIDANKLPDQFDWRIFGAVTPVKDQSVCGSCWSFGTVGAIEGAYFLKTGNLVRLSQQALIDCSWGFGNNGCDGGEDFRAYQWMMSHGGLPTEDEYGPYLGQDGYCHANNVTKIAKITGYVNVTANDENALKFAMLKHGPISVGIDASHRTFSFYSNGVYYEPKCGNTEDELDHAVLAVGYGTINGKDYWLIKNSWSNYWGNDGYVLMSAKDNNCGVMTAPTYVTM